MDAEEKTVDPGSLPDEPDRTAGDAAGVSAEDEGEERKPPPDDLEQDPAYNPDEPLRGAKGG